MSYNYIVFCVPGQENFSCVSIFCSFSTEAEAIEFCANANQMGLNGGELRFFYVGCAANPNQFQLTTLLPTMLKNRYESAFLPSFASTSTSTSTSTSSSSLFFNQTFGDFKKNNFGKQFIISKYNNHPIYQLLDYQPNRAKLTLQGPEFAQNYTVFSPFPDVSMVVNVEYG